MPSDLQKFIDERLRPVGKAAFEAIAEVVTEEATRCYENIKESTPTRTGGLKASLAIKQIEDPKKFGFKIDYEGYNDRGVAYSKIGRTLNKGTSLIQGKHFIDKAVRKLKGMDERINQKFIDKVDKRR